MGRGILSGLFWGSLISVVVLGAVSQLSPIGEDGGGRPPGPEESAGAVAPGEAVSPLMETPDAESTPEPAADPAGATGVQIDPGTEPVSGVDVPAGSEFRKALPETDAEIPENEQAPEAGMAPMAPEPGDEDTILATPEGAAPRPEPPGMSVAAPEAPSDGADADGIDAVSVAPEAPAATPDPAGEAGLPDAGNTEDAPDARMTSGFPPPVRADNVATEDTAQALSASETAEAVERDTGTEAVAGTAQAEDAVPADPEPASAAVTAGESDAVAASEDVADAAGSESVAAAEDNSTTAADAAGGEQLAALDAGAAETPAQTGDAGTPQTPPDVTTAAPRAPSVNDDAAALAPAEADPAEPVSDTETVTGAEPAQPETGSVSARVQPLTERGVVSSRLPQIGVEQEPAAEPVPETVAAEATTAAPSLDALTRNAAPFTNPEGKPLFSIILIDEGAAGLDASVLQTFTFPVTFAIDPMNPDAQAAAEGFAAAGFEVVVLATGLPDGATAGDVETTLGAHLARIPQAVAVMDPPVGGIAARRELVEQAIAMANQDGHGLIGWSRGLGPLETAVRKGGTPVAGIYRALDDDGERSTVIRRYLDRAAFKAAQDGSVIMVGRSRADTVTALFEWALGNKSGQVALAPVSAILRNR